MYLPELFHETDIAEIRGLIDRYPLATLVTHGSAGLAANHIPVLRVSDDKFVGHVALANDVHREVADGAEVLAIFRGDDAYISPNWYPSKQETHKHVPTWNYQAVHVYGRISFQHDDKSKRAVVGRLTKRFEADANGDAGWRMADAPADYMDGMLANIVAFRIEVTRTLAKSKLSQNRAPEDYRSVVGELDARGAGELAARMKRLRPEG